MNKKHRTSFIPIAVVLALTFIVLGVYCYSIEQLSVWCVQQVESLNLYKPQSLKEHVNESGERCYEYSYDNSTEGKLDRIEIVPEGNPKVPKNK